jgi:hypothetical protein
MKIWLRTLLVLILAAVVAAIWVWLIPRPWALSNASVFNTGDFEGCPATGDGGDPLLNLLKNRDVAPPTVTPYEIGNLIAALPQDLPTAWRKNWKQADTDRAAVWESKGVVVEGYLIGVAEEGSESCNCNRGDRGDYHLWLNPASNSREEESMVTEIIPRLIPSHPNWNLKVLNHFVQQHSKMRITGWLMWDELHSGQVGTYRKTLWEIHPIHKIEVFSAGQWQTL